MMGGVIRQETAVFLIMTLHGAAMALFYDLLRALRRSIPHGIALISAEDFLYWFVVGFLTFCLMFSGTEGKIRGYMAVGMGLGALLYHQTLSGVVVKGVSWLVRRFVWIIGRFNRILKSAVNHCAHFSARLACHTIHLLRRLTRAAVRLFRHLMHAVVHLLRYPAHTAARLLRRPMRHDTFCRQNSAAFCKKSPKKREK